MHFIELAEWAEYAPPSFREPHSRDDGDVQQCCREVVRIWTLAELRAACNQGEALANRALREFLGCQSRVKGPDVISNATLRMGVNTVEIIAVMTWAEHASVGMATVLMLFAEIVPEMTWAEQWNIWVMTGLTGLVFFAVGASLGSFLNVVVYRWPRRLPITRSPSWCPLCSIPIPWRDNVPIVGYLRLRGRCQCGENPIAARYPMVEFWVGSLFLALFLVELISGGTNLPLRPPNAYAGVIWIIWFTRWDRVAIYAYHLVLLYVLLGMLLIQKDGFLIPRGLPALGLVLGLVLPWVSPDVQLVPVVAQRAVWYVGQSRLAAGMGALAGLAAGGVLGLVVAWAWSWGRRFSEEGLSFVIGLSLVGTYRGWQAALSVAFMTATLTFLATVASRAWAGLGQVSPLSYLWVCTLGQILLWRRLSEVPQWPGSAADPLSLSVACMATIAFSVLADRIMVRREEETPPIHPETTTIAVTPEVVHDAQVVAVADGVALHEDTP